MNTEMNTKLNTPTPRTDAESFYPDDSKEKAVDSFFAQQLERELATLRTERDQLRAELTVAQKLVQHKSHHADDLFAENVELRAERDYLRAELATERARLDSGQILLTVAGERVWHSGVDLRAAIDAAMKEDAK